MSNWNKIYPILTGLERFTINGEETEMILQDFWRFQYSNIWDLQADMSEFIVSKALGIEVPCNRNGWCLYDIDYNGYRIEVKQTSDWHSWNRDGYVQKKHRFDIGKAYSTYKDVKSAFERQNDIYVFCHLKGNDAKSANPMNLSAWDFYVIPTKVINDKCGDSKSISFSRVKMFTVSVPYNELRNKIDLVIKEYYDKTYGEETYPEGMFVEFYCPSSIFAMKSSVIYEQALKELGFDIDLDKYELDFPYDYFKGHFKEVPNEEIKFSSALCKKEYFRFFELGFMFGAVKRHLEIRSLFFPEDKVEEVINRYKEFAPYFKRKYLQLTNEKSNDLCEKLYLRCFLRVSAKDIVNEYPNYMRLCYEIQEQFRDEMQQIFEIGCKIAYLKSE